jgi:hypothetical protein
VEHQRDRHRVAQREHRQHQHHRPRAAYEREAARAVGARPTLPLQAAVGGKGEGDAAQPRADHAACTPKAAVAPYSE